ncbi:hypothetical protein FBALC1_07328 [Flavobacteriales bacterium ALC-1]|nr:hypothetical protein FBALC1_07328 [Flavobacteriales bacterium ALC-1]
MYNAENYIGNCIESLLQQNLAEQDYEIIIMDDGSSDNSITIVRNYAERFNNIRLYTEANAGAYSTRNKLLKLAKGDYIYNLDSDDYIIHNSLGNLLKIAQEKKLDIIGFKTKETLLLDQTKLNESIEDCKIKISTGREFVSDNRNLRHEIWWYFIRKDFIENNKMSFNNNEYNADVIFTLEALLEANKVGYMPIQIHRYVQTPNSLMRSSKFDILVKRISYFQMMILNKSKLINEVKSKYAPNEDRLISNLMYRRDIFTFFNILNLCRNPFSVKYIKRHIESYKTVDAYPLYNFIGKEYNTIIYRTLIFIVNRPFLIYPVLRLKNSFIKPKL